MRIILWDLDGTLLGSIRPRLFASLMSPVLVDVFGEAGGIDSVITAGMTDRQIFSAALPHLDRDYIASRLGDIAAAYLAAIEAEAGPICRALPGAREALEAVRASPRYRSSVLTGNLAPVAAFKLRHTGLDGYIDLPGAYGDDAHDRRDLPAIAAGRIADVLGERPLPDQFIVIGDTPHDIGCARHYGARVVAVASGRHHGIDELRACRPDAVLPDLTDTDRLLDILNAL